VCNIAISRRATVRVAERTADWVEGDSSPRDAIVDAALRRAKLGAVDVELSSDFPIGAGLGGSSAATVALGAALHALRNESPALDTLAEWSRTVEVDDMRIAGGRQDHYAATFGGALALTFGEATQVSRIALSPSARSTLERQCILLYTGESRISSTTITAVLDGYTRRERHILDALATMCTLARQMADALRAGDVPHLAQLVDEHWHAQRTLHDGISTPRIDTIERVARAAGATGLKALGASGGGCIIAFADDAHVDAVARAIEPYGERLPWCIDDIGVEVADLSTLDPHHASTG
jgi:D-glycero-alpha-D-manno-heptose-7-phosphate kinase